MASASPPPETPQGAFAEPAPPTDADLLCRLRLGESSAYETLWIRHVEAARALARQLTPSHHDDLVSEAFLAVYQQVRVGGAGPHTSFRAYLFRVMRNIAARWYRDGLHLLPAPSADPIVEEIGYERIDRECESTLIHDAFLALPPRWQRVLWMAEVDEASRPAIAAEMGIGANAVSALQRRARRGLREQWLRLNVPPGG